MTPGHVLRHIASYRRAARRAASAGAPLARRLSALVGLAREAQHEPDPTIRQWAAQVIYVEARSVIEDASADAPGDKWERAQRRLRAEMYVRCPTCESPLATDLELEHQQRRRERRIYEAQVREAAARETEKSAEAVNV